MEKVLTGLEILIQSSEARKAIKGNIGYLGNQASVSNSLENGLDVMMSLFGKRLIKAFGPQHGFATSAQDNMIETPHEVHPVHNIPVYSLYSETRIPTDEMLDGLDSLVVDLQDAGTRVYTYIWTLFHVMEAAQKRDLKIVVLDRPNPIGGLKVQGNFPEAEYYSFVCRSKIPMRHGLTIGEMAKWFQLNHFPGLSLSVVSMKGWERYMLWKNTGLHWINPSPNLPTPEGCLVYPGTVLIEGTNLSEGRGTTRSLELIGHPEIKAIEWKKELDQYLKNNKMKGQVIRPVYFEPVYQKFKGQTCGGYQLHVINPDIFNPWKLGQLLICFLYHRMDTTTFWNTNPYEYEFEGLAIDWINGSQKIRTLIEKGLSGNNLDKIEEEGKEEYMSLRQEILMYI